MVARSAAAAHSAAQAAAALRAQGHRAAAAQAYAQLAAAAPDDWLAQYNAGAVYLEAQNVDESRVHLARAVDLYADTTAYNLYAHVLALGGDISGARAAYTAALGLSPQDFAANWGLFEVLQLLDDNAAAVAHQRVALAQRSLLSTTARRAPRATLLELCVAGTFQANIPLDFVLDLDGITVHKLYLGEHPIPELPPYDIVFNTIAQGSGAHAALAAAAHFVAGQDRPVLNFPRLVDLTARDAVAARFADSRRVIASAAVRAPRLAVAAAPPAFPFLIRPLDSHAGNGLVKIDDSDGLLRYLLRSDATDEFYVAPFVDYRSADGYYRKYRIVFVDGVAYPVHLAISTDWMIHYYNAGMADNAWMREEEHAFMRDMSTVFGAERAAALREIAHALPLDYFGIDCAVAPDGRVLLFEASTAMIVHLRDSVEVYPYKAQYVPRIFAALERLFDERIARASAR